MTLWLGYRQLRGSLLRDGPCKTTEERKRIVVKWKEKWERRCQRPFPSSKNSHFQNEAKRKTSLVKKGIICMRIKDNFHIKLARKRLFQYLPSLSINWKIWKNYHHSYQGYNDIAVDIATKWRRYLFYLQPYFSTRETLRPKIVHASVFLQQPPRCSWSLSKVYKCSIFSKFLQM